jgi:hypothetical protein
MGAEAQVCRHPAREKTQTVLLLLKRCRFVILFVLGPVEDLVLVQRYLSKFA